MNIFKVAGKFLDQPVLVEKFQKNVPYVLSGGAMAYGAYRIKNAPEEHRKKQAVMTTMTLGATVASALIAPKLANKVFKTVSSETGKTMSQQIFSGMDNKSKSLIKKSKDKVLKFSEVKHLCENLTPEALDKVIPDPKNITSKEIFSEIGRLSFLGLIPVAGGIAGGVAGDILVKERWKEKVPNKIKEGVYQYLANIFLCNVGAGLALSVLENLKIRSKSSRALGMVGGILTTGVIGGSAIANYIGRKVINPVFKSKEEYQSRHPEALDIGLHTDDIATVAVMSGLKWIEPALPIMYAVSGYRAGIGYRNSNAKNVNKCNEINKS